MISFNEWPSVVSSPEKWSGDAGCHRLLSDCQEKWLWLSVCEKYFILENHPCSCGFWLITGIRPWADHWICLKMASLRPESISMESAHFTGPRSMGKWGKFPKLVCRGLPMLLTWLPSSTFKCPFFLCFYFSRGCYWCCSMTVGMCALSPACVGVKPNVWCISKHTEANLGEDPRGREVVNASS